MILLDHRRDNCCRQIVVNEHTGSMYAWFSQTEGIQGTAHEGTTVHKPLTSRSLPPPVSGIRCLYDCLVIQDVGTQSQAG
jgi:hypothetical protein